MAKNDPKNPMKPSADLDKSIIHMPQTEHYSSNNMSDAQKDDLHTRLDTIGLNVSKSRSDAINGRKDTGIEDEWLEDEEYYEGIDDANRGELKAWRGKPLGAQYASSGDDVEGSTIFLNITRPYVDGVAARLDDILLPTDEAPFSIKPTPNPDMISISEGKIPPKIKDQITEESGEDPERQKTAEQSIIDQAKEVVKEVKKASNKAEKQIWDWCVESEYHTHNRRVIEDAAKVGTGVLKGPIPIKTRHVVYKGGKLITVEKIKPGSVRVAYRNFFPDPACGENIHKGNFTWGS